MINRAIHVKAARNAGDGGAGMKETLLIGGCGDGMRVASDVEEYRVCDLPRNASAYVSRIILPEPFDFSTYRRECFVFAGGLKEKFLYVCTQEKILAVKELLSGYRLPVGAKAINDGEMLFIGGIADGSRASSHKQPHGFPWVAWIKMVERVPVLFSFPVDGEVLMRYELCFLDYKVNGNSCRAFLYVAEDFSGDVVETLLDGYRMAGP
jgi:hypothetical protein